MRILYSKQVKQLEELFVSDGNERIKLMESAGDCITRFIHEKYGIKGKSIAIICGHGNNGGDGLAAARKLLENGAKVRVILADGEPITDDAIDMFGRAELAGVKYVKCPTEEPNVTDSSDEVIAEVNEINEIIKRYIIEADIIVDAIFGLGYYGNSMPDHIARLVEYSTMSVAPVVSVDVPSGVVADTGKVVEPCIRAAYTLTFTSLKPAHVIYPSTQYCGTVLVAQIGVSEKDLEEAENTVNSIDWHTVKMMFRPRMCDTHKGDYGKVLMLCGSVGMAGAAVLSGKAAVHSGAGLVRTVLPKEIYPIVAGQNIEGVYTVCKSSREGTLGAECIEKLDELLKNCDSCLIGCGIGQSDDIKKIVEHVVSYCEKPLIIDADALNILAQNPALLSKAKCPIILTPHIGEMARLTGKDIAQISSERLPAATEFAKKHGVTVVLKGANTIISEADGKAHINFTGNPGMAKGGSGDVLAGIIASFAAQGMPPIEAAICGVHIHGAAGDKAADRYSVHSLTPTDIIFELSTVFGDIEN